ncbi:MAG TPA: hypothetical protein ENN79_07560, partial [Desulfobacteraceae bacterium]|nr:hypothetical protein [Desulfobacteraceae bacterium]
MIKTVGIFISIIILSLAENAPADNTSRLVANLEAGKTQRVVAYGTSLTAGGAWVSQLQQALDANYPGLATVVNSGKS